MRGHLDIIKCPTCWTEFLGEEIECMACAQRVLDQQMQNHKGGIMHYRNGREAKNGDKVIRLSGDGKIEAFGVLHSATPGNDYCNGNIAVVQSPNDYACMVDCLHVDDVAEVLKEKGLEKRPDGK